METTLHGWPGLRLAAGDLEIVLLPVLGGRIASLRFRGEEWLFLDPDRLGRLPDLHDGGDLRAHKRATGFPLWGGDKTWIAPQDRWWEATPPLDLDSGPYSAEVEARVVTMTSPICRETGLRIRRRVELTEHGELRLEERCRNVGDRATRRGLWNVTQMLRPLDVYLPAPLEAVRAYPEEGESVRLRDSLLEAHGRFTRVPCRAPAHFKMGAPVDPHAVVALRSDGRGTLAHVRRFDGTPGSTFAHASSAEVYNSPSHDYLEVEVHGALADLEPGAESVLRSRWSFLRLPAGAGPEEALAATA